MELAIVLLVVLAGVIFYIVRPESNLNDTVEPQAPAPTPAEDLPSESKLMRMKKSDLLTYAASQGINVATASTKAEIVSELTTQLK